MKVSLGPITAPLTASLSALCATGALCSSSLAAASAVPYQGLGEELTALQSMAAFTCMNSMDVDGDGDLDMLVGVVPTGSQVPDPTLHWCERRPGGQYLAPCALDVGGSLPVLDALQLGDMDGDGDLDIVFGGEGPVKVGWLRSLGAGQFAAPVSLANAQFGSSSVQLGDFDGDGRLDVVWLHGAGQVRLRRGLGGGQFAGRVTVALGTGTGYRDFIVADVDQDGDADLAISARTAGRIDWVENQPGTLFAPVAPLIFGLDYPWQMGIGDVDNDGDLDFVVGGHPSGGELNLVLNEGGGTYGAPVDLGIDGVRAYQLLDFNADGLDDLVVGRNGSALGQAPLVTYTNVGGSFGVATVLSSDHEEVDDLYLVDLDLDGGIDVVALSDERVGVSTADAAGFASQAAIGRRAYRAASVATGDLDGDGRADVALAGGPFASSVKWFRNAGFGDWSVTGDEFELVHPTHVEIVDMDADGDMDLLVSGGSYDDISAWVGWAQNFGDGDFQGVEILYESIADSDATFALGDMEGDGDLDILLAHRAFVTGAPSMAWIVQFGPGSFAPGPDLSALGLQPHFRLADVDQDGNADFIEWDRYATGQVGWRSGDGSGSFGASTVIHTAQSGLPSDLEAVDINGDSRPDVIVAGPDGILWYPGDATGALGTALTLDATTGEGPLLTVGDMGADGFVDVFVSHSLTPARRIRNLGNGAFAAPVAVPGAALGRVIIGIADFDGDLDRDVVAYQAAGGVTWNQNLDRRGDAYCNQTSPNSSGAIATITSTGSGLLAANDTVLMAAQMPVSSFGYFLVANEPNFVPAMSGSPGAICIGGVIGRLNRNSVEIFQSDASGSASVPFDVNDVPTPMGSVMLSPGDRRYFQAWFRDPVAFSALSNGLSLVFE